MKEQLRVVQAQGSLVVGTSGLVWSTDVGLDLTKLDKPRAAHLVRRIMAETGLSFADVDAAAES